MRIILIIFLGIISNETLAFNSEDCYRTLFWKKRYTSSAYPLTTIDATTIMTDVSAYTLIATRASTEFISSTGGCRAIDFRNQEKLHYITMNFDRLAIEASKGDGEVLRGLGVLFRCDKNSEYLFTSLMHDKFDKIFMSSNYFNNTHYDYNLPSEAYSQIMNLLSEDQQLKKRCNF